MPDGGYADGLFGVGQLIENPVGAHPQRVQTEELASEGVPGLGFALEQAKSILDRIDQRPAELEQLLPSATGEDEPGQRSVSGRSALSQLAAKVGQGDRLAALDLGEAGLQGGESV